MRGFRTTSLALALVAAALGAGSAAVPVGLSPAKHAARAQPHHKRRHQAMNPMVGQTTHQIMMPAPGMPMPPPANGAPPMPNPPNDVSPRA